LKSRAGPCRIADAQRAGVAKFRTAGTRTHDIGRVAIGLGLMLIVLSELLEIVTP